MNDQINEPLEITEEVLEKAFFEEKANLTINDGNSFTNILTLDNDNLLVTKTENVDRYLMNAAQERAKFLEQRGGKHRKLWNTQDHMTKVASIPRIVYDHIMRQCDMMGMTDKKDRQRYLIEQLKSPEFESFLTIPKNYIRNN